MLCCADGGQILYGIQPSYPSPDIATVRGMVCDHDKRDQFRLSITKLAIQHITPPIFSDILTTHFWPVLHKDSLHPVDDLFVIGV